MHSLVVLFSVFLTLLAGTARATTCNSTSLCPAAFPCCSEFGFCGTDDFCLGGCNPLASTTIDSCKPNPICQDATHTFPDNSRILTNATLFDGNASMYDWVVDKGNIVNTGTSGGELALLLTETNGGTRLSSTRYLHYGTVTARVKTGRWAGVVAAFITMSNIKDEIDWEFPGNATTEGQTNYFWQGLVPSNGSNGQVENGLQDTFSTYHDYTIDWQPKTLTYSVDGKAVRTVNQADTLVPSTGVSQYPSTPARIQISLWPAGINTSAPGTVQWAGGMIDWTDPDYTAAGHFYTLVKSITIKCADSQGPGSNYTSYTYGSNSTADTPSVSLSDKTTLLKSAGFVISGGNLFYAGVVAAALLFLSQLL